MNNRKEKVTGL